MLSQATEAMDAAIKYAYDLNTIVPISRDALPDDFTEFNIVSHKQKFRVGNVIGPSIAAIKQSFSPSQNTPDL